MRPPVRRARIKVAIKAVILQTVNAHSDILFCGSRSIVPSLSLFSPVKNVPGTGTIAHVSGAFSV